jgi:hypothetical protein
MPLYEKRTYQTAVGKMPELLEREKAVWDFLEAEGLSHHLTCYFVSDTGPLHQLIHIWRFEDDNDRRALWKRLYASEEFMAIVVPIRSLLVSQEVQLLTDVPFGPKL